MTTEVTMAPESAEKVADAIERAIPLLILLGNFVGNQHERCEVILACRDALAVFRGPEGKQPQSSDLRGEYVPGMANRPKPVLAVDPDRFLRS